MFATFKRVLTILKLVVAQLDVIETMTPVQFLTFRDLLESSSGFQSGQFRELEAILGRRDPGVLTAYHEGSVDHAKVKAALERPSVYDSFLRYLAGNGYEIPQEALERDVTQPVQESQGVQAALLRAYRDDGGPAQVAERLVDFDEGFMEWRYHHVKMVERTIGSKVGTGGVRRRLPALDAPPAVLPGSLGDPRRALIEGLAEHYSAFRVSERLLLTGHSHQAWPDVGREGQLEAWDDAAEHADHKWERAFAKAERLREGFRGLLADPGGAGGARLEHPRARASVPLGAAAGG